MTYEYCCEEFKKLRDDYNIGHEYKEVQWDSGNEDPNSYYLRFYYGEAVGDYYEYYKIKFCPFCGKYLNSPDTNI